MLRYRLRTLLIVLALGPPVLAAGWWGWSEYQEWRERQRRELRQSDLIDLDLPHLGGGTTFAEHPDPADFPPATVTRP